MNFLLQWPCTKASSGTGRNKQRLSLIPAGWLQDWQSNGITEFYYQNSEPTLHAFLTDDCTGQSTAGTLDFVQFYTTLYFTLSGAFDNSIKSVRMCPGEGFFACSQRHTACLAFAPPKCVTSTKHPSTSTAGQESYWTNSQIVSLLLRVSDKTVFMMMG